MKTKVAFPLVVIAALVGGVASAPAETMEGHTVVTPQDIKWGPGPKALNPGTQMAVLYGDPSKEGLFAFRVKFPKGFTVAPHTHSKAEAIVVLSGEFKLGMGETADESKAVALPAGSFFAIEPNMAHFVFVGEDTEIHLTGNGPFDLVYVNPKDDPRNK